MEQIERIQHMEQWMNDSAQARAILDKALAQYEGAREKLAALDAYYGSEQWRKDFEADEAGLLPADLRRGVLSEDGLYNLLEEHRRLQDQMLALSQTKN